jgi:hypothetical protein
MSACACSSQCVQASSVLVHASLVRWGCACVHVAADKVHGAQLRSAQASIERCRQRLQGVQAASVLVHVLLVC